MRWRVQQRRGDLAHSALRYSACTRTYVVGLYSDLACLPIDSTISVGRRWDKNACIQVTSYFKLSRYQSSIWFPLVQTRLVYPAASPNCAHPANSASSLTLSQAILPLTPR